MFQRNQGKGSGGWCPIQAYNDDVRNVVKENVSFKGLGEHVKTISNWCSQVINCSSHYVLHATTLFRYYAGFYKYLNFQTFITKKKKTYRSETKNFFLNFA
jgi:hypothetical protein